MRASKRRSALRFRSVFLSDVHLGSRDCRADLLLEFLASIDTEHLYLVGDLVDLWALRRGFHWPETHTAVVRTLRAMAAAGTRITYVPGNHDAELRELCGFGIENFCIERNVVHETGDGRRILVLHGDEFDDLVKATPWLAWLGNTAYVLTLAVNHHFNAARRLFRYPYWSLAGYLKQRVGKAEAYISSFERAAAAEARRRGLDGVVCGHIHRAALREIDGVLYANDGDWVESCTALTERFDGSIALTSWEAVCARPTLELEPLGQAA